MKHSVARLLKHKTIILAGIILLAMVFGVQYDPDTSNAVWAAPLGDDPAPVIEPELEAQFLAAEEVSYLIQFRDRPRLDLAYELDWETRGRFVVLALQKNRDKSQQRVQAYLHDQGVDFQSFWVNNSIMVNSSDQSTFSGLLNFVEIDSLRARRQPLLHEPLDSHPAPMINAAITEPNIGHVNADQVWELGYTGMGIVVANIDTGVNYTHQALVNQYRGNNGDGTFDHNYNWWDPAVGGTQIIPNDWHGHGSHTMGTILGDGGVGNQIGMAPDATWIACQAFEGNDSELLECGQFLLAPWDLNKHNPDPARRPHVINNSWGDCHQYYDSWYMGIVESWLAAGIYPVFSTGNNSGCGYSAPPGLNTVGNPARYGNVTSVGSTGTSNAQYAPHSNWGPTDDPDVDNANGYPNLKPLVVAPGVNIRSADRSGNDYRLMNGTSMSAPHVSGLVALMWDAAPCLISEQLATETIIQTTARPVPYDDGTGDGAHVPNYATGWGEIDALAAVQAAKAYCGADFHVDAAPDTVNVCAPERALYDVNVDQVLGFTEPVTLSVSSAPEGASVSFTPNPVIPSGSSVLTVSSTSAIAAGSYEFDVVGISGELGHTDTVELNVFEAVPNAPLLIGPIDAVEDVSVTPTFQWVANDQATYYLLEVASDSAFTDIVHTVEVAEAQHTIPDWLAYDTVYYWRLSAGNFCGLSSPTSSSFKTRAPASILLVDDDDNVPDVSPYYMETLDSLSIQYDVWNTWNSNDEPSNTLLFPYDVVIWFTGDEWEEPAGPGDDGEIALASWLDSGTCLVLSGQDYLWNRQVTSFISTYFGVASFENDVKHISVTGVGEAFNELGTYSLTYPFFNFSDRITPNESAITAFSSTLGTAGVMRDSGVYKTTLWAFPFEAIPTLAERQGLMTATLDWCGAESERFETFLPDIRR